MFIDTATITIDFPVLTDLDDAKPMLNHIKKVITRETGVEPKIELRGVRK